MKRLIILLLLGISIIFAGCSGDTLSPKIDLKAIQNVGIYDKQTGQYVILDDKSQVAKLISAYNEAKISWNQSFEGKPRHQVKIVLLDGGEYLIVDGEGQKVKIKTPKGEVKIVKGSLKEFLEQSQIPKKSLIDEEATVKSLGIFRPRSGDKELSKGFNLPLEKLFLKQLKGKIKPILTPKDKLVSSGLYLNFNKDNKFTFLELYLDKGILRSSQTNSFYQLPKETANGLIEYYGVANIRESILVYQNNVYQAVNVAALENPRNLEPMAAINQTTYYQKKGLLSPSGSVPVIYFLHSKKSGKSGYFLYGLYVLYQPRGMEI